MSQPIFGVVPAGLPVVTQPTETPTPTSFVYQLPTSPKPFSHVVLFLLPGIILPENTAAAIYLVSPPPTPSEAPVSKFLGGVGPGKESAIFKLHADVTSSGHVVLGVSIEDAASVSARIAGLAASNPLGGSTTGALVPAAAGAGGKHPLQPSTLVLAQRIIKNAFNFLSSFSAQAGMVEVVPMRAFEDWWRKFESRVRTDPGFLERDD